MAASPQTLRHSASRCIASVTVGCALHRSATPACKECRWDICEQLCIY